MKLTIIGSGYVGLVTGACLADFGHTVVCVDKDAAKIAALRHGEIPIYEPGLAWLVAANSRAGRLSFTTELTPAVRDAEAVFIAVGTPTGVGGAAELSFVRQAAREIAAGLDGYTVIATKSTVPVGTGDELERIIAECRPDADFSVASNPEFLREGAAIEDFKRPDRLVVGVNDRRARELMEEIYRPLFLSESAMVFTDRRTSELIKYAANAFLATKVTFINEMADLCEKVGANVQDVSRGMGLDSRIGPRFLHPGPGYGGSCFPKDTLALVRAAEAIGVPLRIVAATVEVNEQRKQAMAERIAAAAGEPAAGKTAAILGLTFKPNTDDMRESPSLVIVPALQAAGMTVKAFDPQGMAAAAPLLPGVSFAADPYDCAAGADVLAIVTEWEIFRALDLDRLRLALRQPVIVDLRNIYRPADVAARGFIYHSIGRGDPEGPAPELAVMTARPARRGNARAQ